MDQDLLKEIIRPLLKWYENNARTLPWRDSPTPYHIWLSEIMLQQTRVEAVKSYYKRFISAYPTIEDLATAPEEDLMKLWEGLGYYSRLHNLHKTAHIVKENYNGGLPNSYEELLKLPGIGTYTAGAIASIAFGKVAPAVDGNVMRVISRVTASTENISDTKTKKQMEQVLSRVMPKKRTGDFNQALMELGATVCIPNGVPLCEKCPLIHLCMGNHQGIAEKLPVKNIKKARKTEERTILMITYKNQLAIIKRPAKGLLAGLWELPNIEGNISIQEAGNYVKSLGFTVSKTVELPSSKHIFTHIEWHMIGYHIEIENIIDNQFIFVDKEQLMQKYAIPHAFKTYMDYYYNNTR